jgi:hypothetical protein
MDRKAKFRVQSAEFRKGAVSAVPILFLNSEL